MPFSDSEDPPIATHDLNAPSHHPHENTQVAKALAELKKLAQQEAALQTRIASLAQPYALPNVRQSECSAASLQAYRDFLRRSVRP